MKHSIPKKMTIALSASALLINVANAAQMIGGEPSAPVDVIAFSGGETSATISPDGNVFQFESPAGYEHIYVGAVLEGYLLCYKQSGSAPAKRFDYFGTDNGGFGASAFLPKGHFSQRSSIDNKIQLTQTFYFDGAKNRIVVNMKVKNKTRQDLTDVVVRRQVDFDTDVGGSLGWAFFHNTEGADIENTVVAYSGSPKAPPPGRSAHTMLLSHIDATPRTRVTPLAKVTAGIGNTDCEPINLNGGEGIRGDYATTLEYKISVLGPGQSLNLKLAYKRTAAVRGFLSRHHPR